MHIEFTKEQYEQLLKLVYLGNWIANAIHTGAKDDPRDEQLKAVEDYVFSFAKEMGFSSLVEYDEKFKQHFPTSAFDDFVQRYIDEYDEDCFWEELFYRLSNRDFARVYTKDQISKMEMKVLF